ncbi:MAG: SURF1 family protein [Polaromonas sp.]|nr:SURF1 family protein [Polaromonas sp.]
MFAGLLALGAWQVQRLQWKLALIDRIEQRVNAAPVPAPGPSEWAGISREASEYQRVQVSGWFDHSQQTLVRASTELGRGFWVMTPLQTPAGFRILVNRGFVPSADSLQASEPDSAGLSTITGLLRLSEPGGSLLQRNDAAAGRWYSRDVLAIAASVKLAITPVPPGAALVAPYFVDAAPSASTAWPRGGLTVLRFNNHHIVYAVTWFVLAAMVAAAAAYLLRSERRLRALAALHGQPVVHA